jgi:hypothetical protein
LSDIDKQKFMSDPSEATQAHPHPVSGHRTPREIAADEAGPIGHPDGWFIGKRGSAKDLPSATPSKQTRKNAKAKGPRRG